jgi:hypothetical protein
MSVSYMPAIGPFEKVSFTTYANIRAGNNGSVVITTGDDSAPGAEFILGTDGSLLSNGVAFSKGGGSAPTGGATEQYVDESIAAAVDGLASEAYVADQIQAAVGAGSGSPSAVPAWTKPALLNNWRAHPDGPIVAMERPGFRKVGHRVEFTGSLAGGEVVGAGLQPGHTCVIFRLPVGYRPLVGQKTLLVSAPGNTVGTIKVFPDGQVVYIAGAMQGEISLHGVSFPLD